MTMMLVHALFGYWWVAGCMHGYLKQSASSLGCVAFQLLLSVLIVGIRQLDFQELVA